jgi:BirA family transcriptional regulator, biotin operon repressor / biotin---[acetyl-CoA-carboxylase] ligase
MKLIKLDAIDSTNDFLKKMSSESELENFTVVTAKSQTNGRGQMGSKWSSEYDKNLIASILIKETSYTIKTIFTLNVAVSHAVIQALKTYNDIDLFIKWPNDILANNKKIGGILIENSFKSDGTITSIIGIGINTNQTTFDGLPNASSLALQLNKNVDNDVILFAIIESLKKNIAQITKGATDNLWNDYKQLLFKFEKPCAFEDINGSKFMGMIVDVTNEGKLCVMNENGNMKQYNIKEIIMMY